MEQQDISLKDIQSFLVKLDPYHEVDLLRIPVTQPEMTFDNIEYGKLPLVMHSFLVNRALKSLQYYNSCPLCKFLQHIVASLCQTSTNKYQIAPKTRTYFHSSSIHLENSIKQFCFSQKSLVSIKWPAILSMGQIVVRVCDMEPKDRLPNYNANKFPEI